ncbi:MAG: DUF3794 domain-containing protein [Ruminococcaceae bacterium]|nr:DUF3794 domain-containing protein [Oscillospiraceae bacterium]
MSTKIFYDNMLTTAKLAELSAEHSVETEILLADYDQPVFKIVKSTMEHSITQKYITKNKLVTEGFIRLSVYYQPPEGEKLSVATQRIPFQKQFELPLENADVSFINVYGNCQYINARPQNPTRIDIRGAYMFTVKVCGQSPVKAVSAAKGNAVCCNSREVASFYLSGQNIRQFTIEDELDIDSQQIKIIRIHTCTPTPAVTTYQGKLTSKGEVVADIYYTLSDSREVKKYSHTFLYNQIIDVSEVKENHVAYTDVSVTNVSVSYDADSKKYLAGVTVQLDAVSFAKQEIIAVTDAFSCCFDYRSTEKQVLTDKNIYQVDKTLPFKFTADTGRDSTVCHIIFDISPVRSYYEINKTAVKAKVSANIITLNSQNEYECSEYSEDIMLSWLENCGRNDEILVKLTAGDSSFVQSGDKVQVNVNLYAQGFVIEKEQLTLLESFEEDTDNPCSDDNGNLTVYYAQKGEQVFDIAKQHRAQPQHIMDENELQNDILMADQMIFIPAFEQ